MSTQATPITNRLTQAGSPFQKGQWERQDGYYVATCRVSPADFPQLIALACKWRNGDWSDDLSNSVPNEPYLPVHAWRALAELKSAEAVEPLIDMLCQLDDWDDVSLVDLPHVFGKIGKPAIGPLVPLASDTNRAPFVRSIAASALQRVAEYYPEARDEVVAYLTEMMTNAANDDPNFNSDVLVALVELRAVEAAQVIERAFAGDCIDVGVMGDWEDVRIELGVRGMGLEMPKHPYITVEDFRIRSGMGIFSEEPIWDVGEGGDSADLEAYYRRAWDLFSKSPEGKQVIERSGTLEWIRSFLEFGIEYRAEIVDGMTVDSVAKYVFDYVPRMVSTKPDSASKIIWELTKFWEYVDGVFDLREAKSIVEWLKQDGLADQLQTKLADPSNYGMEKSIVMAGMAAGYDMTSQEDVAEFLSEYNRQMPFPEVTVSSSETIVSDRIRVGRNEPCPCGSGKKYKKCCYRS